MKKLFKRKRITELSRTGGAAHLTLAILFTGFTATFPADRAAAVSPESPAGHVQLLGHFTIELGASKGMLSLAPPDASGNMLLTVGHATTNLSDLSGISILLPGRHEPAVLKSQDVLAIIQQHERETGQRSMSFDELRTGTLTISPSNLKSASAQIEAVQAVGPATKARAAQGDEQAQKDLCKPQSRFGVDPEALFWCRYLEERGDKSAGDIRKGSLKAAEDSQGLILGGAINQKDTASRQYAQGMIAYVTQDNEGAYFWLSLASKNNPAPTDGTNYAFWRNDAGEHLTASQKSSADQRVADWKPLPAKHSVFPPQNPNYVSLETRDHASQGDAMAEYYVGEAYIPEDYTEAAAWLYKAAVQGQVNAQTRLSGLYFGNKDYVEAYFWESIGTRYGGNFRIDSEPGEDFPVMHLTPEQKAAVDKRVEEWNPTPASLASLHVGAEQAYTASEIQLARYSLARHEYAEAYFWFGLAHAINPNIENSKKIAAAKMLTPEQITLQDKRIQDWHSTPAPDPQLLQGAEHGDVKAQLGLFDFYTDDKHINYTEAYFWAAVAANNNADKAPVSRDDIAKKLSPEQKSVVDTRIREWSSPSAVPPPPSSFKILQESQLAEAQAREEKIMKTRMASPEAAKAGQAQDAGMAFQQRNFAEALRLAKPLAEEGNPGLQMMLGQIYGGYARGFEDYAEAVKWYQKSAYQGNPTAQELLARMYLAGNGVTKDYEEAYMWMTVTFHPASEVGKYSERLTPEQIASAKKRAADVQYQIGQGFEQGTGVKKDYVEAYKWYCFAADGGDQRATEGLARVTGQMTEGEIASAKGKVKMWMPAPIKEK